MVKHATRGGALALSSTKKMHPALTGLASIACVRLQFVHVIYDIFIIDFTGKFWVSLNCEFKRNCCMFCMVLIDMSL